jgi:hypothetical protein
MRLLGSTGGLDAVALERSARWLANASPFTSSKKIAVPFMPSEMSARRFPLNRLSTFRNADAPNSTIPPRRAQDCTL